ncbi:hypothetical protein HZA57_01535, partial [Candidatus Poribacteria bacterium]|nr:hypothetical protein [Candidatus Poribacteria bacterium]
QAKAGFLSTHGLSVADIVTITGAAAEQASRAGTRGEKQFRVAASQDLSKEEAQSLKEQLVSLGYVPAEVVQTEWGFTVYAGPPFVTIEDANRSADGLLKSGFPLATAVEVTPAASAGTVATEVVGDSKVNEIIEGYNVTEQERARIQDILNSMQAGGTPTTYDEFEQQRKEIQNGSNLNAIVQKLNEEVEALKLKDQAGKDLLVKIERAQDQGDYDLALRLIEDLKRLDPDNPIISEKSAAIAAAKKAAGGSKSEAEQRIVRLVQTATQYEAEGRLDEAKQAYQMVLQEAKQGQSYDDARANIDRISKIIREKLEAQAAVQKKKDRTMMTALIAGAATVICGIVAFVVMMGRSRKRDEELLKQVQTLAGKPTPPPVAKAAADHVTPGKPAKEKAPAGEKHEKHSAAKPASPAEPEAVPAAAQVAAPTPKKKSREPEPMVSVGPSDRIRPGVVSPASESAHAGKSIAEVAASTPIAPPPGADEDIEGLKLDFLFGDGQPAPPKERKSATPAPVLPPAMRPNGQGDSSTEFAVPPMPDVAPGEHPAGLNEMETEKPAPAAAVAVAPVDSSVIYFQDFEDEEAGKAPRNWRGFYDYATLTVANGGSGNGASKCLRFEKKSGIGSAYYSCRFPDAQGRICVEFDIRCDDKNKYLLGFYIEKDEDFRQSIHTIVHRSSSKANPTLRIQGEPTPYEFGTWKHVKFEIDLPRHLIDGEVEGNAVATGVRLNSCPKVINTLSIRDNLATTGVLMIDNIRISRV